jgi:hypothetical protein
MDAVQLILYAGASFLALRALVSLMAHHREHVRQRLYRHGSERRRTPKQPGGGKQVAGGAA